MYWYIFLSFILSSYALAEDITFTSNTNIINKDGIVEFKVDISPAHEKDFRFKPIISSGLVKVEISPQEKIEKFVSWLNLPQIVKKFKLNIVSPGRDFIDLGFLIYDSKTSKQYSTTRKRYYLEEFTKEYIDSLNKSTSPQKPVSDSLGEMSSDGMPASISKMVLNSRYIATLFVIGVVLSGMALFGVIKALSTN